MQDNEPGPLRSSDDLTPDPVTDPEHGGASDDDSNSFAALRDDITALLDDARTYAEAEIAFQKTRAGLAGKSAGRALALLVLAVVLLHIALIALAVGAVIALAPLVTIWGAIAIVVGVLLVGVALLLLAALGDGKALAEMFGSGGKQ
jgi:hypothetical protein